MIFGDFESAMDYLTETFPAHQYRQERTERNYKFCRMPGCTSRARVTTGHRFLQTGELIEIYLIIGCTFHQHPENTKGIHYLEPIELFFNFSSSKH